MLAGSRPTGSRSLAGRTSGDTNSPGTTSSRPGAALSDELHLPVRASPTGSYHHFPACYAFRDEAVTKRALLPYRTGRSAHTVVPGCSSSPSAWSPAGRTPQRSERRATMPSPRPPIDQVVGSFTEGAVGAPPSVTVTSTLLASRVHETRTTRPGRGLACRRALLISSLSTSPASHAVPSKMPALVRSRIRRRRATPTLEAVNGSISALDVATSIVTPTPPRPRNSERTRHERHAR